MTTRIAEYSRTISRVPAHERALWEAIGEGDPDCFPQYVVLFKLLEKSLDDFLAAAANSGGGACALWPELPPITSNPCQGTESTLYETTYSATERELMDWANPENQLAIADRIRWGIDANFGEFFVSSKADPSLLRRLLPPSRWDCRMRTTPVTAIELLASMRAVCEQGEWIGRYMGAETNWCLLAIPSHRLDFAAYLSATLGTASQTHVLRASGSVWHPL